MEYLRFSCRCSPEGLSWYHDLYLSILSNMNLFCVGCKLVIEFHFFACVQIFKHHLLKRLFLLHFMLLPLCQILIDHRDLGSFLGSLFCSIDLCTCFYASTTLFWLQLPCNTVWYQVLWSLLLCSSFSKLLQLFRVVYGSI